jgi:hypothetical protein
MEFKDQIVKVTVHCAGPGCKKTGTAGWHLRTPPDTTESDPKLELYIPNNWTEVRNPVIGMGDDTLWVCPDCEKRLAAVSPFDDDEADE